MNEKQINYMLTLLREKSGRLQEEHKVILKSKHLGMNHVNAIIDAMETNNELIMALERAKKEVDNGIFGFNH
jgi:hypothetical protein